MLIWTFCKTEEDVMIREEARAQFEVDIKAATLPVEYAVDENDLIIRKDGE